MALSSTQNQNGIANLQSGVKQGSGSPQATSDTGQIKSGDAKKLLADEHVTLSNQSPDSQSYGTKNINSLLEGIGKDTLFLKETLRNKIAELRLNPATRIEVKRDTFGRIQAVGNAPATVLDKISKDLNNSQSFREAFTRTQQQKPTADYINNVSKLQRAYGATNQVYNSVLSDKGDNSLTDITLRYQKLKEVVINHTESTVVDHQPTSADFKFVLNA